MKPTDPEALHVEQYGDTERRYPCEDCGALRTKAEGGTTFTVCDACWDKAHAQVSAALTQAVATHEGKLARIATLAAQLRSPENSAPLAELLDLLGAP